MSLSRIYLRLVVKQNVVLRTHRIYHQYQKSVKLYVVKEENHNGAPNGSRLIDGYQ